MNPTPALTHPPPIETARCWVREVEEADLRALLEVNGDDGVTQFLPYATWQSMADAYAWLKRMTDAQATGAALQFAVIDKAGGLANSLTMGPAMGPAMGLAIGTCLLFRFDDGSARAELGYVLGRAHWGRGLMHEALQALIASAFTTLGLRRLEAEVDPRNAASRALLLRLGFRKEGLLRQRWVTKGRPTDVEVYGLLRDEWAGTVPGATAGPGNGDAPGA